MSYRHKSTNNKTFISNKSLNKSTINSSLINISKQLNNISINDVNILKLTRKKSKMNLNNKTESSTEYEFDNISTKRGFKYRGMIYKILPHFNELNQINFSFCHIESFSIKADKDIHLLNNNDLRKKNFILKENLKFLLNEIKKYKKNELTYDNNQIKEYENKIEYYVNEIKKYKRDIIILKEKYNNAIKKNNILQKYILSEKNKTNDLNICHCISKTDINNTIPFKQNEMKKKNSKKNDLNLNARDKNNKESYSTCTTRESRNNKTIDLNIINNINSNKYLLLDDKNTFKKSKDKILSINNNLSNKSGFINNTKIINKINKTNALNDKKSFKKLKIINKNKVNQIIFKRLENKKNKILYNSNTTLSENKFNQKVLKNNSFELNKTINYSQSLNSNKNNVLNQLMKENKYHSKKNNYIYLRTFNE